MELVPAAALITAFLAGIAALFAPCCIGVLLPSYLASIFKTKSKIFLMTFVYYLGLLTIFLPLGVGISYLGSFFAENHAVLFTFGALFMIALGVFMLLGKSYMLPFHVKPQLKKYDFGSIYVLGIFSGVATSCCAPVLAGVLALSFMPGSLTLGAIYSLAFVTGLVLPLFIVALFIDKTKIADKLMSFRKKIHYTVFGKKISVNLSHFVAGLLFIAIGLFILIFERTNTTTDVTTYQLKLNLFIARTTRSVTSVTGSVSEWIWALIFVAIFVAISYVAYKQFLNAKKDNNEGEE